MENLTLNEYQEKAMTTCMSTCNNIAYMSMNLFCNNKHSYDK